MHALRRHIALAACAGGLVLVGFGGEPSKAGDAFRPASIAVTVNTENVAGRSLGTASACDTGNWHWRNPLPQGNFRRGVWGSEASDVWAVGDYGTIQHWDGTAWSCVWSGTTDNLYSVWGTSASDIWAVGQFGTIKHWDGSAWTKVPSGTTNGLTNVWGNGASDIWAVGNSGTIVHWDGSAWTSVPSGTTNSFLGVWGSGANDV